MRRLALLPWVGGLVVVVRWLPHVATGDDPSFNVVRAVTAALAWYLLAATVVNVALTVGRVRFRLPGVAVVVAFSLSTVSAPAFATGSPTTTAPISVSAPPVMHRLPDPVAPTTTAAITTTLAPSPATWTVRHGVCFWSIAAAVVGARLGHAPATAAVVPYWHSLIEANRPRLADPAHPGLVFTGQILILPSPGAG